MPHCSLTAIICAHNPRRDYFSRVLGALRQQTLDLSEWGLLIIDNGSPQPIEHNIDLSWHPNARVVVEDRLGLSHARIRSFHEVDSDILVYLDDDNLLHPEYLARARAAMKADASLGAAGGKSIPNYEVPPPPWFAALGLNLACRDLGEDELYAVWPAANPRGRIYPACAPIGAGLVLRRQAYESYIRATLVNGARTALGRKGGNLASAEDNDIVMCILEDGWRVAYLPQLQLDHLIPARRLTRDYLAQYARGSCQSWVEVLDMHHIGSRAPIPRWSLPLRKVKAYFVTKAWSSDASYISWQGRCGIFEGQARLAPRK